MKFFYLFIIPFFFISCNDSPLEQDDPPAASGKGKKNSEERLQDVVNELQKLKTEDTGSPPSASKDTGIVSSTLVEQLMLEDRSLSLLKESREKALRIVFCSNPTPKNRDRQEELRVVPVGTPPSVGCVMFVNSYYFNFALGKYDEIPSGAGVERRTFDTEFDRCYESNVLLDQRVEELKRIKGYECVETKNTFNY